MITPNKVVPLAKSALGLTRFILEELSDSESVSELQERTSKHFESVDQFILTVDLLFVLGRLNVDFSTGRISHAV
jgi:hypothetical protein